MRLVRPDDLSFPVAAGAVRLAVDGRVVWDGLGRLDGPGPTQLVVCPDCGIAGCSSDDYAHVSMAGAHVLWTRTQGDPDLCHSAAWIEQTGGLAFTPRGWAALGERVATPSPGTLPAADTRVFLDALLAGVASQTAAEADARLRQDLLAATRLSVGDAVRAVTGLLDALAAGPPDAWEVREVDCLPETLYLDGPRVVEWALLAWCDGEIVPRLAPGLVLTRRRALPG